MIGKRSNFERRASDFYPTPLEAVPPLIPFLRRDGIRTFAEPCACEGDLIQHLESFGLRCVYAGDKKTGQDALAIDHYDVGAIITHTPYKQPGVGNLVRHFTGLSTLAWLLLRLGVASPAACGENGRGRAGCDGQRAGRRSRLKIQAGCRPTLHTLPDPKDVDAQWSATPQQIPRRLGVGNFCIQETCRTVWRNLTKPISEPLTWMM
jgi:hypothetical protein